MKILNIILKVVLCLLMLMPIIGALGVFPAPTADMYNTPQAFTFIQALMSTGYINQIMAVVALLAVICIVTGRTALAALLVLPLTVNIVAFHLMLDAGLFTGGAVMADVLGLLNLYFLWQSRGEYKSLLMKSTMAEPV